MSSTPKPPNHPPDKLPRDKATSCQARWSWGWPLWAGSCWLALVALVFSREAFSASLYPFYLYGLTVLIALNGFAPLPVLMGHYWPWDVGLAFAVAGMQGMIIHALGRFWFRRWQPTSGIGTVGFPLGLLVYYTLSGSLSVYRWVIAVSEP